MHGLGRGGTQWGRLAKRDLPEAEPQRLALEEGCCGMITRRKALAAGDSSTDGSELFGWVLPALLIDQASCF
jgi:hypothetical protein